MRQGGESERVSKDKTGSGLGGFVPTSSEILSLLSKAVIMLVALMSPIHGVMLTTGGLIFVDFVTGIWAAHKRNEEISSSAMRRTVSKFLIYQMTIISAFFLETYMMGNILPVTKLVASVIGMVEFKSILENANSILGVDIFKHLVKKLGSKNDA